MLIAKITQGQAPAGAANVTPSQTRSSDPVAPPRKIAPSSRRSTSANTTWTLVLGNYGALGQRMIDARHGARHGARQFLSRKKDSREEPSALVRQWAVRRAPRCSTSGLH